MADWATDVKKYAPKATDEHIAGIVRHCGIALQKQDSALVSFADPDEVKRVKEGFLTKKLGVTDSDAADKAIEAVAAKMKGAGRKNRVTVYYLLAEHFGKLDLFEKKTK